MGVVCVLVLAWLFQKIRVQLWGRLSQQNVVHGEFNIYIITKITLFKMYTFFKVQELRNATLTPITFYFE